MYMKMSVSAPISKFLNIFTILLLCFSSLIDATCLASEKQALIEFRKNLKDPSGRLSSWIDHHVDCCKWKGVVCSNKSGNVIQLHLQNPDLFYLKSALSGKISPSLLNLTQLHYLDLSLNDFKGIRIPSFFGSLQSLRYLNLSLAGFQGMVPHQLGNLSSLRTLSIQGRYMYFPSLQVDNFRWLAGLSNLKHLNMNYVDLRIASNWLEVINMIPSLVELHLSSCYLIQISQLIHVNFSSLAILDLSFNSFRLLPRWIFSLNALVSLDLNFNSFENPWPRGPWNLTSLNQLDIFGNQLDGSLPGELFNLNNLISLDLGQNILEDSSFPYGNWNLSSLKSLDLSNNNFNWILPNILFSLSGLSSLILAENSLQGSIPNTNANISNLQYLDLSSNYLNSSMPKWLYNCTSLEVLGLNNNQLQGVILDDIIQLEKLRYLTLSDNSLSGSIPLDLGRLSSLEHLDIANNKLTGSLPKSLGQLSKLEWLDISHNLMEGIVTEETLENLTSLSLFDASRNSLTLKVSASWIPRAQFAKLCLSSWNLRPKFPTWLHSQKHIGELDLSLTGISGTLPSWLWNLSTQFGSLNLSHNHLHGEIPNVSGIGEVDLNSNRFSGPLPQLNSQTVSWLDLSNNFFYGGISHLLCDVKNNNRMLTHLDLGDNSLTGEIPDCWMNWPNLNFISLNNNNFTGTIPRSMINLENLDSLHLRNNSLSGQLPLNL